MMMEKSQNETEILNADESKLREICRSLKKVDAPKDFDFKLKARIASASPGDFQPRFGFAFRYALPALALIMVLGLLAYNGGFLPSDNNPSVAKSSLVPQSPASPQETAVSSTVPSESNPNENLVNLPADKNLPQAPAGELAVRNPKRPEAGKKSKAENDDLTTSEDKTFKTTEVLNPRSFELKSPPQNSQPVETLSPIPVREIFSQMGITADLENGKWTVRSVTANSIGESSGVKENDIIEAIDAQPVSAATVFEKIVKGKTLTITREGEKSQIELRNKQ